MLNLCALKCQKLQTTLQLNLRSKYSHLKCSLQILSFHKEIWASSSVSTVKLSIVRHYTMTDCYYFAALDYTNLLCFLQCQKVILIFQSIL